MYKILLFKDLLTLSLLSMSMYSLKEKCKVCGTIIKYNEVTDNRPLLKSDKVPSKVIENLVDWTKDYDGCCQLLLSPYNWSSIGVSLPPMAVSLLPNVNRTIEFPLPEELQSGNYNLTTIWKVDYQKNPKGVRKQIVIN